LDAIESAHEPEVLQDSLGPSEPQILLIEDAGPRRNALVGGLLAAGYRIEVADGETEAFEQLGTVEPDLVLLDLAVNNNSGVTVCTRIHKGSSVPIVLLAPPGADTEILLGLEMGASDFLTRPINLGTLVGRLAAMLEQHPPAERVTEITAGPITVRPGRRAVSVRGKNTYFAKLEYDLLLALLARPGHIRTHQELLDQVWQGRARDTKSLNVHIRRLRHKIEVDPADPKIVITARGIGYYFDPEGN